MVNNEVIGAPKLDRSLLWPFSLNTGASLEPAASKAVRELSLDILSIFACVFFESHMACSSPLSPVYSDSAKISVHLDGRGTREARSYRA